MQELIVLWLLAASSVIRSVKLVLFMNTGQIYIFKDFKERARGQLVFLQ